MKNLITRLFFAGIALGFVLAPQAHAAPDASLKELNDALVLPASGKLTHQNVEDLLATKQWVALDPTWPERSQHQISVFQFGPRQVVRILPHVAGLPVLGATRILSVQQGRIVRINNFAPLITKQSFGLGDHEALLIAHEHTPRSIFVDPTVERIEGFTTRLWLVRENRLVPTIKVRIPTLKLEDLRDTYIDASSGRILKRDVVALFADGGVGDSPDAGVEPSTESDADGGSNEIETQPMKANVFVHAPAPEGIDDEDLIEVTLEGLNNPQAGDYLSGLHFETRNCCKYHTCSTDLVDGACPLESRVCTDDTESEDAILSELALAIPTSSLPSAVSNFISGETLHARSVFCAELPRAMAHETDGEVGYVYSPVDKTRAANEADGLASEEDAFVEVQVYHASQQFFEHIRATMEDPSFCLEALSMQCNEDGTAKLDENGEPLWPFKISTNLLMPEIDLQSLGAQLFAGLGQSAEEPVIIDDYQRLGNAAFVPSMQGSPIEVPDGLDSLTEFFNRPYDSNIYLQGDRDFAYDGDIVYHEFTHALVHTLAYGLGQSGYDRYGSHVEAGALNEGWSDYFSASFTNDSATGEYGGRGLTSGETGLRDADNDKKCPDDLIGEVHADSEPVSGALWALRSAIQEDQGEEGVHALDQMLLSTIAEAEMGETFTAHLDRVLAGVTTTFGEAWAETATEIFNRHAIHSCVRVHELVTAEENGQASANPKDLLLQPDPASMGLDFAPSVMQFKISVPANTDDITLIWSQASGGDLFGGGEINPLKVLVAETEAPIEWRYEGSNMKTPTPYFADGNSVPFDIQASELISSVGAADNNSGLAPVNYGFNNDSCEAKTYHVSLLSAEGAATLYDVTAAVVVDAKACGGGMNDTDEGDDEDQADEDDDDSAAPSPQGCGCSSAGPSSKTPAELVFVGLLLLLFGLRASKRRRTVP